MTDKSKYPQYENNCARVIAIRTNGAKTKAIFYWNGEKPTFAAYGSDITESVIGWEYEDGGNR